MSDTFKAGDRVIYGLDNTSYSDPKLKGSIGTVIAHRLYGTVDVRLDYDPWLPHRPVRSCFTENLTKIGREEPGPRKMVRGDLVSRSLYPQSDSMPTVAWGSVELEYGRPLEGVRVSIPHQYSTIIGRHYSYSPEPPRFSVEHELQSLRAEVEKLRADLALADLVSHNRLDTIMAVRKVLDLTPSQIRAILSAGNKTGD